MSKLYLHYEEGGRPEMTRAVKWAGGEAAPVLKAAVSGFAAEYNVRHGERHKLDPGSLEAFASGAADKPLDQNTPASTVLAAGGEDIFLRLCAAAAAAAPPQAAGPSSAGAGAAALQAGGAPSTSDVDSLAASLAAASVSAAAQPAADGVAAAAPPPLAPVLPPPPPPPGATPPELTDADEKLIDLLLQQAATHEAAGNLQAAVLLCQRVVDMHPWHCQDAVEKLVSIWMQADRPEKASCLERRP